MGFRVRVGFCRSINVLLLELTGLEPICGRNTLLSLMSLFDIQSSGVPYSARPHIGQNGF